MKYRNQYRFPLYYPTKGWMVKVKRRAKKLEKSVSKYIRDLIDEDIK